MTLTEREYLLALATEKVNIEAERRETERKRRSNELWGHPGAHIRGCSSPVAAEVIEMTVDAVLAARRAELTNEEIGRLAVERGLIEFT